MSASIQPFSERQRIPIYAMKAFQIADCGYVHMQPNNAKSQSPKTRAWLNFLVPAHMATFLAKEFIQRTMGFRSTGWGWI
jgi:hypothetical protein